MRTCLLEDTKIRGQKLWWGPYYGALTKLSFQVQRSTPVHNQIPTHCDKEPSLWFGGSLRRLFLLLADPLAAPRTGPGDKVAHLTPEEIHSLSRCSRVWRLWNRRSSEGFQWTGDQTPHQSQEGTLSLIKGGGQSTRFASVLSERLGWVALR